MREVGRAKHVSHEALPKTLLQMTPGKGTQVKQVLPGPVSRGWRCLPSVLGTRALPSVPPGVEGDNNLRVTQTP